MIVLVIVLLAVGGYCGWRYYNDVFLPNKQIKDADRSQREYFGEIKPDDVDTPDASEADGASERFAALTAENDEAVGWLTIDGTVIDYPVAQAADNYFYLDHGFDKQYNWGLGCPFLDYRCKSDFTGFNSLVYAHHISGYPAMFSEITYYKDSGFMAEHPTGVLLTKTGVHRVRFFAYMIIPNPSFAYVTELKTKSEKEKYIDDIFENAEYTSVYSAYELKKKNDLHLLLLSTCTYEYWQARGVLAGVIE